MIRVQREDFDVGAELAALSQGNTDIGGLASFIGVVRDRNEGSEIASMTLEHYPGMTEKALEEIEQEARKRWKLDGVTIIHRYGNLEPGARIVLVAVASSHRESAFDACRFLMDWLKTKAPFWKVEATPQGERWVEARDADDAATEKWK